LDKKIIVSVISDLVTDQRVQKECNTLAGMGYEVVLVGRKSSSLLLSAAFPYKVVRLNCFFRRGPLMYLAFNTRLFFFILFKGAHILWANDLDSLLPNFIISRLKRQQLIYDSHEYFTESVYKPTSRKIWALLERILFPRLKHVLTVNDSIKQIYEKKYKVPVTVIRNVPLKQEVLYTVKMPVLPGKKVLVMQGIGLNENRGAEEAVMAMQFLPDIFNLFFIGKGTILARLMQMVQDLQLSGKVTFIDTLPYQEMMAYTRQCFLGLIFEKIDVSGEHLLALPNKFFDYLHAGIPVLSSKAIEIQLLIERYQVGDYIDSFDPGEIAKKILGISKNEQQYLSWKKNTVIASEELNWQNEERKLVHFMQQLG
jgi:glycosyltransferase involved in cell wall biosynthesis